MVARTQAAYDALVAQLASSARSSGATWRWCGGVPEAAAGVVDAPIGRSPRDPTKMAVVAGGREARTRYEVRRAYDRPAPSALLECRLETGRTHQIRVHLAAIGHPVVGDATYGGARPPLAAPPPVPARRPARPSTTRSTGERLTFESPLPADLAAVLPCLARLGRQRPASAACGVRRGQCA